MTREEREKVYRRRPSDKEQHADPPSEEAESELQPNEYNHTPPRTEPETQASFVPLSFGTYGPQSQWNEPSQPDYMPEPEPYSSPAEQLAYKQSWIDDSGYYDQEIEMQEAEGDDRYWFEILSQTQPLVQDIQSADEATMVGVGDGIVGTEVEVEPGLGVEDSALTTEPVTEIPIQGPDIEATRTTPLQPEHSASSKLAAFMHLKAKPPSHVAPPVAPSPSPHPQAPAPGQPTAKESSSNPTPGEPLYPIPDEIRPLITLTPDTTTDPEPFKILANMQMMHHRALVSALEHPSINLHLVERSPCCPTDSAPTTWSWQDTFTPLHGASFALDPSTAIVLVPLVELASPDAVPALSRLLQSVLTRFEWVGLILEAYPRPKPQTRQPDPSPELDSFTLNPFTPPTLKSLSALRRALVLLHNALGLVPIAALNEAIAQGQARVEMIEQLGGPEEE
ncbi:hypothetical protein FS749_004922 [Ceratobasidium sp. UAMH 11750]|nr:hypothetical protein FS749_004922 [Ceratobasidium sp. UAMH 11750]